MAFFALMLLVVCPAGADPETLADQEIDGLGTVNDEHASARKVLDSVVSVAVSGASSSDEMFQNSSLYGNNVLWRDLVNNCGKTASLSCVKKNVFNYLDQTVSTAGDVAITESLIFTRNNLDFENKYNTLNQTEEEGRTIGTFEGIVDVLYEKGMRFIQSHDLRLQLPQAFLEGAVLRLSPRALQQGHGGALLTVEPADGQAQGRIFFKHKKMFRRKLLLSLFALLLVVKLVKVAVMFILPVIFGVGTAKKILLKVLLFLFPALTHLFKFCSYYHGLHASKYHHHHHQIAHHHHHVPVHVPVPVHVHHDHHVDDSGPLFHASGPGTSYHHSSGGPPSWGPHDYTSRSEYLAAVQHNENELAAWGIGGGPGGVARDTFGIADSSISAHHIAYNGYLDEQRVSRSAETVTEPTRFAVLTPAPSVSIVTPSTFLHMVQPLKAPGIANKGSNVASSGDTAILRAKQQQIAKQQQATQQQALQQQVLKQQALQQQALHQHILLRQQQLQNKQQSLKLQVVTPRPAVPATTVQVTYDPFYSPILQKMDNVFVQLGFNEEVCRERLVCSMYKNPPRFTPHSNLLSAELSRDESELRKPAVTNSAVARFHRYVQAARDGQGQKDCLRLYPACTVNTEL